MKNALVAFVALGIALADAMDNFLAAARTRKLTSKGEGLWVCV